MTIEMKARTIANNNAHLSENPPEHQKILVVEDDFALGEVLKDLIQDETPYKVFFVSSGEQALQLAKGLKPDLLLLDYQLPGMNGLELYDILHTKKDFAEIPVLFMSANPPVRELEKRHISFIKKPFELDEVLSSLKILLSNKCA